MADIYRTIEGDTVDLIAFRRFGKHGMEFAIFEANPFLAALEVAGGPLPAGLRIHVPTPEVKDRVQTDRLWS